MNIKFWDTENKIMYEDNPSLAIGCTGEVSQLVFHDSDDNDCVEWQGTEYSKHIKPIFSTGLKDKNGIEIYDSDILSLSCEYDSSRKGIIEFKDGCFIVRNIKNVFNCELLKDVLKVYENAIVIGNIFENKDMLK